MKTVSVAVKKKKKGILGIFRKKENKVANIMVQRSITVIHLTSSKG